MRAAGLAALAFALGVTAVVLVPAAGAGTSVLEVGWWSRSPFSSAPEGGVTVGAAPDGTTALAAMRLDLGRGVAAARIRLAEAGGFAHEVAAIEVCRGADAWEAAEGGDLDDAPEPRCGAASIELTPPAEDGDVWTADLAPIVRDASGPVTVMLVPDDDADLGGTVGLGYEVAFGPPVFDAAEVPASGPPQTNAPPTTAPDSPTPTTPPAAVPRSTGTGGRAGAPTFTPTPTTTTEVGDDEADNGAALGGVLDGPPTAPGDAEDPNWARFGLFVLLSAGIGTGAGLGRHILTDRLGLDFGRPRS